MVNIQREGRYTVFEGDIVSLFAIPPHWGTVKDSRGKVLGCMVNGQFYVEEI